MMPNLRKRHLQEALTTQQLRGEIGYKGMFAIGIGGARGDRSAFSAVEVRD